MASKNCRVCGYELDFFPWGEDNKIPSHEICDCCGTEFGYEDSTIVGIRKKRNEFISSGLNWFDKKYKPDNWSFDEQLKNIPKEYL